MYSTSRGTSFDRQSLTDEERPLALQKLTKYFKENVRATGSVRSISTFWSGFSILLWFRSVTDPFPISPVQANLTPSLVASIATISDVSHPADKAMLCQDFWRLVPYLIPRVP